MHIIENKCKWVKFLLNICKFPNLQKKKDNRAGNFNWSNICVLFTITKMNLGADNFDKTIPTVWSQQVKASDSHSLNKNTKCPLLLANFKRNKP